VIPLRIGAGLKNKVTESMAYGLPLVSSSVGAEGSGLANGISAFVTDQPKQFAEDVIRLYHNGDMWLEFSRRSLEIVQDNFSAEVAANRLKSVFAN
jgi:glycosyltransferase involved in cell wall biosynthesis